MKIIRNFGIALFCCAILVSGQNASNDDDGDEMSTTPVSPTPTTTISTTERTTVSTKTPTTTTTEPPPDTTTSAPSTTTPKPAPAPIPTTPTPSGPDYPRNTGKWSVEDEHNSTCIALKGAMQIVVKNHENQTLTLNVPKEAAATGICKDPQSIILTWASEVADENNTLTLSFELNNATKGSLSAASGITNGKFGLQKMTTVLYFSQNSTNTTDKPIQQQLVNLSTFQTPLKHSYSCLAEEPLKQPNVDITLKIREVQLEAYRLTAPGHRIFSTAVQCPADDATDVVPIAVGAALTGLVVIVLIAYLIGRRRSRARGYQSV